MDLPLRTPIAAAGYRLRPALACLTLTLSCVQPEQPPNVLLIVVDTWRADHLDVDPGPASRTPHLAQFAAGALRFTGCQSPRAKTTPAVASILTGLYPHAHGVRDLTQPLAADVPLVSESFARAGYRTFAIVGNYVLSRGNAALDRGFDHYVDDFPESTGVPPLAAPQRTARSLTDGALRALGLAAESEPADASSDAGPQRPLVLEGQPWFGWLHYMDPHGHYAPPAPHDRFDSPTDPIAGAAEPALLDMLATYNVPADAYLADGSIDAARVRDLYAGEVHYADAEIGRLLDELSRAGLLENTIVVVTSDHGESLGEHGYYFEHGRFAYEATCRVPLLIHMPLGMEERPLPGVRHADLSLVDLAPTLLDLAGLRGTLRSLRDLPEGPARGISRAGLILADDERPHPVFSEKIERTEVSRTVQTKTVRIGRWKFLRRYYHERHFGSTTQRALVLNEELYDLESDPAEAKNLLPDDVGDAPLEVLRAELARFAAADARFADQADILQAERERLRVNDPEKLRALEALGY